MVDTGATSHIITDINKFKHFDDTFKSETQCVELADGTLCRGVPDGQHWARCLYHLIPRTSVQ